MFKKRAAPAVASRARADEDDGEAGAVPTAPKRSRQGAALGSSSNVDSGLIVASSKRGDVDLAAARAEKVGDAVLSGLKANDSKSFAPSGDAVRRLEIDTDVTQDNRAVLERNEEIHKGLKDGTLEAGIYRGLGGYKQYAERGEGAISMSKYTGKLGPLRGNATNVRSTLRIEYIGTTGEGGICKDYKETGYCGFGDSCKFLHDRSDYKPSYILEQEWEAKQKAIQEKKQRRWQRRMQRRQGNGGQPAEEDSDSAESKNSSDEDSEDELPQRCPNCNTAWEECKSTPIQTVCGHYFCEDCALSNFARTPKCMTCDAPTNGIFNTCDALEDRIKQKKAQAEAKRKAKRAASQSTTFGVSLEQ